MKRGSNPFELVALLFAFVLVSSVISVYADPPKQSKAGKDVDLNGQVGDKQKSAVNPDGFGGGGYGGGYGGGGHHGGGGYGGGGHGGGGYGGGGGGHGGGGYGGGGCGPYGKRCGHWPPQEQVNNANAQAEGATAQPQEKAAAAETMEKNNVDVNSHHGGGHGGGGSGGSGRGWFGRGGGRGGGGQGSHHPPMGQKNEEQH